MAYAQAGRCLSALFAAAVLIGTVGPAEAQDTCRLLVFQPGQTDGEVADTAPIEGSICFAFGVAPGQDVDVTLTYGRQAAFSIAGLIQDKRRYSFTAERSLYEIRVHQSPGASDVAPFVLAIHADPLPIPEPPAPPPQAPAAPPVPPERTDVAAAEPEDVGPSAESSPPLQTASATEAQPDATPPAAPDERVYGPGWSVAVDDDSRSARVQGTATDYVTRFQASCAASLPQGVHVTLSGNSSLPLSHADGSGDQVRLTITADDGSKQTFDATLAYRPEEMVWQTGSPLPTAFLDAFSDGVIMAIRTGTGRTVASYVLYGLAEARDALRPLCVAGPAVASAPTPAPAQPVSPTPPSGGAEPGQSAAAATADAPPQAFVPGWVMSIEGGIVVATGGTEDGATQFVGRCTPGPGLDVTLRGDPGQVLDRADGAVDPVRIAIVMEDRTTQQFDAVLAYDAAEGSWRTQVALPTSFLDAFGYGIAMRIDSAAGARIADFRMRETLQMVLTMNATCSASPAVSAAPAPPVSVAAAEPPAPPQPEAPEPATPEERTYGPGWTVTVADDGGDVVVAGAATDYTTRFQAHCDVNQPAGVNVVLSGPSIIGLSHAESTATPVRIQVTADDGTARSFTTALTYSAAQDAWRSGLPLSVDFIDSFAGGAVMKVMTDPGITVATFLLYGQEGARDPMTKICSAGSASTQAAPSPPPVQQTASTAPAAPAPSAALTAEPDPNQPWVVETAGDGVSALGTAVDAVSMLQLRCGTSLPAGLHLTLRGDPHRRLERSGSQPVHIEITGDTQASEVFNTVLAYQDSSQTWTTQLPLPASFVHAFGRGVVMKILTADDVPAVTFLLYGTGEARDRMIAVCGL